MSKRSPTLRRFWHPKHVPWLLTALTLLILAGTIWLVTGNLRNRIREQIINRDGEVLYAMALSMEAQSRDQTLPVSDLTNPLDQLNLVLQTSRIKGVLATRLFSSEGNFVRAFPDISPAPPISKGDLTRLNALKPVSHFGRETKLSALFPSISSEDTGVPLLHVFIPLYQSSQGRLLAVAEFILDGQGVAEEFATLDRNLIRHGSLAFLVSSGLLIFAMGWAFRRLQQAHAVVVERTSSLLQANNELALMAKTSALGAVSAHLIHGLRNPLSALKQFVTARAGQQKGNEGTEEWEAAAATAHRMQVFLNEVVRMLREEKNLTSYEITLPELVDVVRIKLAPLAKQKNIHLITEEKSEKALSNRDANIILLILENLLTNALEASPPGKCVWLRVNEVQDRITCEIQDQGSGLAESVRNVLFLPLTSTKTGGSGLGLAISKQLAKQIGAELDLKSSSDAGTVFLLSIPTSKNAANDEKDAPVSPNARPSVNALSG